MSKRSYTERLKIPVNGSDISLYTRSGLCVAHGYIRVVIGGRGPYIEFDPSQILIDSFHIPKDQEYRQTDRRVYYVEFRSNDESNVKLYYQKKTVQYADYKIGLMYISLFDLKTNDLKDLVEPLKILETKEGD